MQNPNLKVEIDTTSFSLKNWRMPYNSLAIPAHTQLQTLQNIIKRYVLDTEHITENDIGKLIAGPNLDGLFTLIDVSMENTKRDKRLYYCTDVGTGNFPRHNTKTSNLVGENIRSLTPFKDYANELADRYSLVASTHLSLIDRTRVTDRTESEIEIVHDYISLTLPVYSNNGTEYDPIQVLVLSVLLENECNKNGKEYIKKAYSFHNPITQ